MSRLRDIQYHVVTYTADANGGPGARKAELTPHVLGLTLQRRRNLPGMAAFTLVRPLDKLDAFLYMRDHFAVFRETGAGVKRVFSGKIVKPSMQSSDTVIYGWDYLSWFQLSRTGYRTLYPEKFIGSQIVSPEFDLAKAVGTSPFAFVTKGTIEDPLGNDGVTKMKTNAEFGLNLFNRLFVLYSLAEMAMANTGYNVQFEITHEPPHTFNFWKDYGTARSKTFVYPGNLIEHDYVPGYDLIRNDRATVVSDPDTGEGSEYAATSASSIATYRRLQDAVTLRTLVGITTGTTETDQAKAALQRLLKEGIRLPKLVNLYPRQGEFDPEVDFTCGDTVPVILANDTGGRMVDADLMVEGWATAWSPEAGELLQVQVRTPD